MKRWNLAGPCLAALLVLAVPPASTARAQSPVNPKLQEQLRLQEEIYRSRGEKTPEGYVINRSLLAYSFTLPEDFSYSLAFLGSNDRWLDIGAGEGQAVLDYYSERYDTINPLRRGRRADRARAVAMSIEDRRTPEWQQIANRLEPGRIQYLYGKRLREYSMKEMGRFQVITDVIGGFSYANDLTLYMEQVLAMLETGGSFYSVLQDVHSEAGTNQPHYAGSPYLTEIVEADGSRLKICAWLKRIACAQVTCELRTGWRPNIEVYHIRKTCDEVAVPPLTPTHYEAGTPPERRYQVKSLSAAPAVRPVVPGK